MQERELITQLQPEGFANPYGWEDTPPARYPDHTRGRETAHIILSGVHKHAILYICDGK